MVNPLASGYKIDLHASPQGRAFESHRLHLEEFISFFLPSGSPPSEVRAGAWRLRSGTPRRQSPVRSAIICAHRLLFSFVFLIEKKVIEQKGGMVFSLHILGQQPTA